MERRYFMENENKDQGLMDKNVVDNSGVNVEQFAALTKQIEDLQAEINSYKTENEAVLKQIQTVQDENSKLKEMNYTFVRHFDASQAVEDIETQLFNMFEKKGES